MKYLSSILLLILPLVASSQLVTNTGISTNALVQNVLQGPGVTISNISFTGSASARGAFTANNTNLGMTEGIILTTGTALNLNGGPHGPNNEEGAGIDNGFGGYGPLSAISGGQTYNAAILEFDFETCSDSVSFNYIFASEEYLEYCETQFNDVFGFFISGPGIAGQQNIATLPNGSVVAINNIHGPGVNVNGTNFGPENAQYYVNNNGGPFLQYDGFTTKLTAKAAVQCNQTYHMVLAVADVGDGVWDSGIFLEANSFTASNPVDLSHTLSVDVFNDNTIMAEGCVSTTLTLERSACNLSSPMTIPLTVSGTATEGVDYATLPPSITFPAGAQTTQLTFDCFQDGIAEGQESLTLDFLVTDNCGNQSTQTLNLFIRDIDPVDVQVAGGTVYCPGEEVELIATPSGGAAPYTYQWSTGETTQSIFVSPASTETFTVTVTDDCLNQSVTTSYEVVVPVIPPLITNETPDITEICPYIPATLDANASGGTPPYTYQWSSTFDANIGTGSSVNVTPWTTTTYTVEVTDACGQVTIGEVVYTITSPPLVLTMSPAIEICPGDSAFISVSSEGGYGQHYYNWLHSGESTPGVWVHPSTTTTYTVSVSDECQTFTVEGSTQVIVIKPTADFTTTSTTFFNDLPITFMNTSLNAVDYEWDFGDGNTDDFPHPSNTYDEPGLYYITLIAIDEKGCRDTIVKPINIEEEWYIYVPNTFTPDGDEHNDDWRAVTVGIKHVEVIVFNRWGESVFIAEDRAFVWDGTYEGRYVNDGTYTYKIRFQTNSGRDKTIHGHVNILR